MQFKTPIFSPVVISETRGEGPVTVLILQARKHLVVVSTISATLGSGCPFTNESDLDAGLSMKSLIVGRHSSYFRKNWVN